MQDSFNFDDWKFQRSAAQNSITTFIAAQHDRASYIAGLPVNCMRMIHKIYLSLFEPEIFIKETHIKEHRVTVYPVTSDYPHRLHDLLYDTTSDLLRYAVTSNKPTKLQKSVARHGKQILNFGNSCSILPLMFASIFLTPSVVKLFLEQGADINGVTNYEYIDKNAAILYEKQTSILSAIIHRATHKKGVGDMPKYLTTAIYLKSLGAVIYPQTVKNKLQLDFIGKMDAALFNTPIVIYGGHCCAHSYFQQLPVELIKVIAGIYIELVQLDCAIRLASY